MKRFYKLFACWVSVLLLVFLPNMQSYASLESLLIRTDSNALMTMELDDSDYAVTPMSSIGTVSNTVVWDSEAILVVRLVNDSTGELLTYNLNPSEFKGSSSGLSVKYSAPSGYSVYAWYVWLKYRQSDYMPPAGVYQISADISSQFSYEYQNILMWSQKAVDNASPISSAHQFEFESASGDVYIPPVVVDFTNSTYVTFETAFSEELSNLDFVLHLRFVPSSGSESDFSTAGTNTSDTDYQSDVSSSISGISSSVDEMTGEISEVADAIDALRGAMEPHYDNVLTQLHHITEQLHAFWDQLYNMFYLPQYARLGEILDAIRNMESGLGGIVSDSSSAIQAKLQEVKTGIENKLQSVQEAITNGFDNQGINQDAAELDQSLQEYEEAEQTVLDQVNDSLNDFEFDAGFDEYTSTVKVFSDFLQDLYDSSGGFKVVINLSLMLSIAGIVIGVYRFRDGG